MPARYIHYIILYLSLAVFIMPMRLMGIFNTVYIVLPLSFFISILISFKFFSKFKGKGINKTEAFLMFYPFLLIPLGIANNHPANYILTDTLKPFLWVSIICYFKNIHFNDKELFYKIRKPIFILALASAFTVTVVNIMIFTVGGVRPSASDVSMLFAMFYYLVSKNLFAMSLMMLIFILGGKVGPLVSLLLVLVLYFLVKLSIKKLTILMVIIIGIAITIIQFDFEVWIRYLPILTKFSIFFDDNISYKEVSVLDKRFFGGRLAEVKSSMIFYINNPYMIITGAGVGYVYDLNHFGENIISGHHGVHFSPISMLTIYGLFYMVIFYIYLIKIFFKSLKIMRRGESQIGLLGAYFFVSNLANSFTVFAIFSILLFPLSIGLVLNNKQVQYNVKVVV